ncbi:MAG: shikimate dehydrogenase [Dehalococcoidia bacterium]
MTKRAGVIGHPLGHSISPALYAAAFKAAGIDGAYDAWDTPPETLQGRVDALRGDGFLGANVTIPHKRSVLPMLDSLSEVAQKAGAVNTIVHRDGKLIGENTDVVGFARSLREDAGFDAKGKRCVLLGAGGAARAVALALIAQSPALIAVYGRTPRNTDAMVVQLKPLTPSGTTITWAYPGDGSFITTMAEADLVVNSTPVGVATTDTEGQLPFEEKHIRAGSVVFDLVYNPPETPLLKAAKARGAKAVGGLGMLVYQAAESFRLWTGQDADLKAMLTAGRAALAR